MRYCVLFLLVSQAFAFNTLDPCNNGNVIQQLTPGASYYMANDDPSTIRWYSGLTQPTTTQIQAQAVICQTSQAQLAAYQIELTTTTAAVVALGPNYVGSSALTQLQYNAKLIRITQLRSFLGL